MERLIGKIKWFSSRRNGGVLTNIGGERLDFSSTGGGEAAPFAEGQVVTYRASDGTTSPYADDVRAQSE